MSRSDSEYTAGTPVDMPEDERLKIEAEIQSHLDSAEALIGRLDSAAPDENLEDTADDELTGDDEPSLGWPGSPNQVRALKACFSDGSGIVDAEEEHDGREPSLASIETLDQRKWLSGARDDREVDAGDEGEQCTDIEPDTVDDEPKHVPADMLDQSTWSGGVR